MESCILNFCLTNYKDDEINEKFTELYSIVKFIMDYCGICENDMYSNIAIFDIIHSYLGNKISNLNEYRTSLVEYMFRITP